MKPSTAHDSYEIADSILSFDAMYAFLKAHCKHEYFEGRNGTSHWHNYSQTVARDYLRGLANRGYGCVPGYESQSGVAIYFDTYLTLIEGDRLQYVLRGQFLQFEQQELLDRIVIIGDDVLTTGDGNALLRYRYRIEVGGKQVALVWSDDQSKDREVTMARTVQDAIRNSRAVSTLVTLLKSNRHGLNVDVFV